MSTVILEAPQTLSEIIEVDRTSSNTIEVDSRSVEVVETAPGELPREIIEAEVIPIISVEVPTPQFASKGDTGDSAYQIAVKNGFEGDESAWLASLVPRLSEVSVPISGFEVSVSYDRDKYLSVAVVDENGEEVSVEMSLLPDSINIKSLVQLEGHTLIIKELTYG